MIVTTGKSVRSIVVDHEQGTRHTAGDIDCEQGWCGGISGYPRKCACGGLIHAEFGEEFWDDYSLITKCDSCGE